MSAITNAKKRKAELLQELADIEKFLSMHAKFGGPSSLKGEVGPTGTGGGGLPKAERNEGTKPSDIVNVAREILASATQPLNRGELLAELERRGLKIEAADKPKYVGTLLWRNGEIFTPVEGRGYWLKERGLPPPPAGKPEPERAYIQ